MMALVIVGCLDPEKFKEFKLVKRIQLSHNVAKFKFALSTPTSVLGLPIGQHMSCRFVGLTIFIITYTHDMDTIRKRHSDIVIYLGLAPASY